MTTQDRIKTVLPLAALAMAILAGPAPAGSIRGQLGLLTPDTLAGNNPATGAPWAIGDTYRFAFIASEKTTAQSPDISTYNAFVQDLANATTFFDIGIDEGVTWKVIGSTSDVDAIDNTGTTWTDENPGCPIFLLDGCTLVARDYEDLWDGDIQHIINLTENGDDPAGLGDPFLLWPWTGTYWDGTASEDHGGGSGGALGSMGGSVAGQVGQGNASSTTDWIWRIWTMDPMATPITVYALSDPLAISGEVDGSFRRGDADADGNITIGDPISILNFQFVPGSPVPPCLDAIDIDDDGVITIGDPISLLNFQFVAGSPPPAAPGPNTCGPDPTPDDPFTECVFPPCQ